MKPVCLYLEEEGVFKIPITQGLLEDLKIWKFVINLEISFKHCPDSNLGRNIGSPSTYGFQEFQFFAP